MAARSIASSDYFERARRTQRVDNPRLRPAAVLRAKEGRFDELANFAFVPALFGANDHEPAFFPHGLIAPGAGRSRANW